MKELKSDDIKNAIADTLLEVAPQYAVFKEAMTKPTYPHFYIHLINVDDTEERKYHHRITYSFDVRFRIASDQSTDLTLQRDLDEMALQLLAAFDILECTDGVKVRCADKNYEKTDGVLHFFFKITVQTKLVNQNDDTQKLGKLESVSVNIRG